MARADQDAFGKLYDRYGAILFGIVLRILRSRAEAEDVLQDTFLQIWQRADTFDEARGRPLPWLAMLARSRALDRLRGRNLRDRVTADLAAEPEAESPDTAAGAALGEETRMVREALAEIPEAQRAALLLAYFDGFSQSEIAARLEKPLGTVKTHTRLGLMRLRELLTEPNRRTEPRR
ncbi:MAG: sigma-70 family RNA polymerase sigma factor [Candidatus Binatia bacterium]